MEQPHGRGGLVLACKLVRRDLRHDLLTLYAVFRALDDAVDEGAPDAQARVSAVEDWCRGDVVRSGEARLLAGLAQRHPLPREALLSFCAAMRHDLANARLHTEADLDRYCGGVAGSVALTVTAMLGSREPCAEAAARLGIALQRTNVLRDLDEDLAAGRIYVATETLERCGGSLRPGERSKLVRDQLARADALYPSGLEGVPSLRRGRLAVAAAAFMYREILRQIEREGLGERRGRAVVPLWRRLLAAGRGALWLLSRLVRPVRPVAAPPPAAP